MLGTARCSLHRTSVAIFATLSLASATATRSAEDRPPPSPEKGHTLAQRFCTGCHVIDSSADSTVPAGIPTFRSIANKPGQTGQHIMNILIRPHPPMPDIHLSNLEILDIVAYLETLRTDKSAPPLLSPPAPASKPEYPEPS